MSLPLSRWIVLPQQRVSHHEDYRSIHHHGFLQHRTNKRTIVHLNNRIQAVRFVYFAVLLACCLVSASGRKGSEKKKQYPVGLVSGKTPLQEFGAAAVEQTHYLSEATTDAKQKIRDVWHITAICHDPTQRTLADCAANSRAHSLRNVNNAVTDYVVTHGIDPENIEIKVVVNAEGLQIFRKVSPFSNQVKDLMDKGVRFYLCLSTVRNLIANGVLTEGNVAEELIEGVEFVPSGVTAVPDLQRQGYVLVKQDP